MSLRLIIPPAAEPLTLAEAKQHCRIDTDTEDALLLAFISAARRAAEHRTGRAFITQTWERVLDAFPPVELNLGIPPIQQVLAVRYVDAAGLTQTLPSSAYVLDDVRTTGWVLPAAGYAWPGVAAAAGAVRVQFVCGMGDTAAAVADKAPEARQWMLLHVAALYENRAALAQGRQAYDLPGRFVDSLLDGLRVY